MAVAPSFEKYKRLSEPFEKNGKMYVRVEHPNTHNARDVRWYNEFEYAKAYGKSDPKDGYDNLKQVRGFADGPILVIRNVKTEDEEWLKASCARFAVGIGWHIVSTDELPQDAPPHFKYTLLGWDEAKIDERHLKDPKDLATIILNKIRKNECVSF